MTTHRSTQRQQQRRAKFQAQGRDLTGVAAFGDDDAPALSALDVALIRMDADAYRAGIG